MPIIYGLAYKYNHSVFLNLQMHSLVSEALQSLGVKGKQPDPGSWTVSQVSFWMENKLVRTAWSYDVYYTLT